MIVTNPLVDYGHALKMKAREESYNVAEERCSKTFRKKSSKYTSGYADAVRDYQNLNFLEKLAFVFGWTFAKSNAAIKVDEGEYPPQTK